MKRIYYRRLLLISTCPFICILGRVLCDFMPPISYDQTKHWFQLFIDVIEMQTRIAIQQTAGAYRI